MNEPIKVLVVDDHNVVREGLVALLGSKDDVVVIGQAADGDEAIQMALALKPDVILLDLVMPNKDGIKTTREIKVLAPEMKILILSSFMQEAKILAALEAGASGYQSKTSQPNELLQAIQDVYNGDMPLHPTIARKIFHRSASLSQGERGSGELTERERVVLTLLADGYSNREIAEHLNISERTASTHVSRILSKLNLENRTKAALYAYREGFVDDDW